MNDLQSFARRGDLYLGWKQSLALLSPAQTSAAYRADLKKQHPFPCTVSGLCLQPGAWTILGRQLLVLLLACLSPAPPSKCGVGRHPNILDSVWIVNYAMHTDTHTKPILLFLPKQVAETTGGRHVYLSKCTVSCASEFVEMIQSRAWILVSSPQNRMLVTGTPSLWKLPCLNSHWSWDNS